MAARKEQHKRRGSRSRAPASPARAGRDDDDTGDSPTRVLTGTAQAIPPSFIVALRRVLRPMARLLLDFQVPFPYASSLLKAVYVEVGSAERSVAGGRPTDSRISLLTGVHRKEVKRLREEIPEEPRLPESVSLGAQIVQRWTSTPRYLDERGRPKPLPRSTRSARTPSFDRLVESVSKDIRPRAVLDEWLHLGVAELDDKGRVCLRAEGFVPQRGLEEKAFYFGRNLGDHMAAAAHNLRGEVPPLLERSVSYGGLRSESVEELEALAAELAMDALRQVNRRAAALQRRDARETPGDRMRITLGAYFFKAREEPRGGDA